MLVDVGLLGVSGGVAGLLGGRIAARIAAAVVGRGGGPAIALPPLGTSDVAILLAAVLLALLAAIVPAITAYRLRPAQVSRT